MKIFSKINIFVLFGVFIFIFSFSGCNGKKADFIELKTWFFTSGIMNNIININYDDNDVICRFEADKGWLSSYEEVNRISEQVVEAKINQDIGWSEGGAAYREEFDYTYVSILLLKNSKVKGYGVVKVITENFNVEYEAEILVQELFVAPISIEKAYQLIEEVKEKDGKAV